MAVSIANSLDHPSLLGLLADGKLHSGEDLARTLGVSRAAVWKGIERLRMRGIDIAAVRRRGYSLERAVELLDGSEIRRAVQTAQAPRLRRLEVAFDVDSTNARLLAAGPPPHGSADVLLSELQHAGRGRRGRHWIAPFGGSIALSLGWVFADDVRVSPALSLSAGVAVARALARAGARGIGLKWPNDIWFADRKVGGVLLELRAQAGGNSHVVIGVGVNIVLAPQVRAQIEGSGVCVAALADACAAPPSRNFVAGAIIDELLSMLAEFEHHGFAACREQWQSLDALRGRRARVLIADRAVLGTAWGVDEDGALRLDSAGCMQTFVSGEASLRLDEDGI